jgi:hypothetical protein
MRLSRALGRPLLPCAGLVVPPAPRWLRWPRTTFAPGLRHHPTLTYCKPRQRQPAQQQLVPPGSVRAHLLQARVRACPSPGRRRRQAWPRRFRRRGLMLVVRRRPSSAGRGLASGAALAQLLRGSGACEEAEATSAPSVQRRSRSAVAQGGVKRAQPLLMASGSDNAAG